ncbi:MAG TPA: phosphoribosylglycinamide formyltransferase [Thermodesulfobacteriota bacterium]
MRIGVLASGRGTNLQAILDACADGRLPATVALVVSDREGARALARAAAAGVATRVIPPAGFPDRAAHDAAVVEALRAAHADTVVLAGYMRLVTPMLLRAFPNRVVNVHPALLPAFPGLHAQRQALEYGVKVTGCTVHFVDEGVDTGPIILQAPVPVADDDDEARLAARILVEEHRTLVEALRLLAEGRLAVDGRRVRIR